MLVLVLMAAVFVGIQYERSRVLGSDAASELGRSPWLALDWDGALKIVAALLLLAAIGIVSFMTVLMTYRAVTQAFEHFKTGIVFRALPRQYYPWVPPNCSSGRTTQTRFPPRISSKNCRTLARTRRGAGATSSNRVRLRRPAFGTSLAPS